MVEHIRVYSDKCKACRRCEVACIAAHHNLPFKEAMKLRDSLTARVRVIKEDGLKTTVRCHQCDPAPCANICPTHALKQDAEGRITMDEELCAACGMCIAACPYGAIAFDAFSPSDASSAEIAVCSYPRRDVAVRCDMCSAWRMENGKKITACMEACPAQALAMVMPDGSIIEMPAPVKKAREAPPKAEQPAA